MNPLRPSQDLENPTTNLEHRIDIVHIEEEFISYSRYYYMGQLLEQAKNDIYAVTEKGDFERNVINYMLRIYKEESHETLERMIKRMDAVLAPRFYSMYQRQQGAGTSFMQSVVQGGIISAAMYGVLYWFHHELGEPMADYVTPENAAAVGGGIAGALTVNDTIKGLQVRHRISKVLEAGGISRKVFTRSKKFRFEFAQLEQSRHPEYYIKFAREVLAPKLDKQIEIDEADKTQINALLEKHREGLEVIYAQKGKIDNQALARAIGDQIRKIKKAEAELRMIDDSESALRRYRDEILARAAIFEVQIAANRDSRNTFDGLKRRRDPNGFIDDDASVAADVEYSAEWAKNLFLEVERELDKRDLIDGTVPDDVAGHSQDDRIILAALERGMPLSEIYETPELIETTPAADQAVAPPTPLRVDVQRLNAAVHEQGANTVPAGIDDDVVVELDEEAENETVDHVEVEPNHQVEPA